MRRGVLVALGLWFAACAFANEWDPIPESHYSVTVPRVDPDADAEAIFRKVRVFNQTVRRKRQSVWEEYHRIKLFSQRGVEQHSTVDLVSSVGRYSIDGLRARTIKPDGRVIELDESAIFERTAVRAGGAQVKVKAFSMPGVEPGDTIEYRWKRIADTPFEPYMRFDLQGEIPAWSVSFHIKPNIHAQDVWLHSMKVRAFNMSPTDFEWDAEGFYSAMWKDVEAFEREPRMPPENHVRRWILFFDAESYLPSRGPWISKGVELYEMMEFLMKVDRPIKKKAAELTAGIRSPEDKVKKIREFCLYGVRNSRGHQFDMTAEERRKLKINHKPSDILKRGVGQWYEINLLFATLVKAAGIDARLASCAGRDNVFFDPDSMDVSFLDRLHIAVRIGEEWKFYDLSNPYLEEGMLLWQEEGVQSLISDPVKPVFAGTPYSGPERSRAVRKATLKLLANGSLEGAVEETFFGHLGVARKMVHEDQSDAEREKSVEEAVRLRLGDARVANIRFENLAGSTKPYTVRYEIQASDYAERTGKRLFLRPAFFQRNVPPEFIASERKHDVYFHYSWSEHDEVSIEIPPGFELENAAAPSSAKHAGTYAYSVALRVTPEKRLLYSRHLRFGENGTILFPVNSYPALKKIFDFIHEMDNHVVALRDMSAGE